MEYDPSTNFFLKPNPKMCEFGDTAVIIADYNEFIERFGKALFKKYDSVVSMMDRVKFYNFRETRETNPLFEKHEKYSYQNVFLNLFEGTSWVRDDGEVNWCEYMLYSRAKDSNYPMMLAYKYFNDKENDEEVERRMKYEKGKKV